MNKSGIFSIFAKSPIKPLQRHIDAVLDAVNRLPHFNDALQAGNWAEAETEYNKISEFESAADQIKQEIRLQLPNNLFLPVPRSDILELLSTQDKIANKAKDISGLMLGRQMQLPEIIRDDFTLFLKRCVVTARQAQKGIHELDELLETGFGGNEAQIVSKMIDELDSLERETDKMQIEVRAKLYAVERDLPPVDVIFYYNIFEVVGELADRAQRVGHRLQILLAR